MNKYQTNGGLCPPIIMLQYITHIMNSVVKRTAPLTARLSALARMKPALSVKTSAAKSMAKISIASPAVQRAPSFSS